MSLAQPDASDQLVSRDVAALTESMTVDEFDVRLWNDDEVRVYSGEESDYVVNVDAEMCECHDHAYRGVRCKHIRRAQFALGLRAIPDWVQWEKIDPTLRRRLNKRYAERDGDV